MQQSFAASKICVFGWKSLAGRKQEPSLPKCWGSFCPEKTCWMCKKRAKISDHCKARFVTHATANPSHHKKLNLQPPLFPKQPQTLIDAKKLCKLRRTRALISVEAARSSKQVPNYMWGGGFQVFYIMASGFLRGGIPTIGEGAPSFLRCAKSELRIFATQVLLYIINNDDNNHGTMTQISRFASC